MKLQILIPQYTETNEVVKPLLDSIALQQNVPMNEIGVVICNDGSDVFLSDDLLNSYPYKIEYYKEPHRGVSATRNACLDYATADYVMFCDADDMFCNVCGLWVIFREMNMNGGFDSLSSLFIEETRNPQNKNEVVYINREMDSTFVHGKVHRRDYLVKNGIRWNNGLTIHEDSYFNILCQNLSKNVKYCPMPFYLWKWRDDSVCRHDPKYILKTYRNMIDSNDALVDEFLSRGIHEKAAFFTAFMIFDAYYAMNKEEWKNQENQEYRDSTERRFAEYFDKHKDIWNGVSIEEKMSISNQVRSRNVMEGMRMEAITIDRWLMHIEELGKENRK
jgi:glycosyltransferase involved in cell wall biosynthesis